ncbi:hypothetical protein EZV62_012269 [Acer yangbiense]|uniref:Uncharacterized protein n=1 Tax=Acer yangbiense TaxID=1000413 RepID=A0A5C7HX41_9ROSI|nr:hypothetical protein EZV62_012269 [Acer yangbiense]
MGHEGQKQSWYSLLPEEEKEVIRKRRIDAYAQKKEKTRSGMNIEKDKTFSGAQKHVYEQGIEVAKNDPGKSKLSYENLSDERSNSI